MPFLTPIKQRLHQSYVNRLNRANLMMVALLLFVGFLVIYPISMLVYGSFNSGSPLEPGAFTLKGYVDAYSNQLTYQTLATTLWLGIARTLISITVAVLLAWIVTRTDTPKRRILEVMVWLQFFLPLQPLTVSWILLAAPKIGMINQALNWAFNVGDSTLNIYSYGGIIWVSSIQWASVLFILITPAFRGMDAALEESSRMSGANGWVTLSRVTIPLLMPSILGAAMLAFVKLMETFEIELFLGFPSKIYVFSTRIWFLTSLNPPRYPEAMALTVVFLGIIFLTIALQWKILGQRQYITVTGRGFATRPTRLGRWRYLTLAFVLLFFIVGTLTPLLALITGSLMKMFGVMLEQPYTTQHWRMVFGDPRIWDVLKNTLYLGVGAATIGMIAYSLVSYIVVKTKLIGRRTLDFLTWLPWGIPAIILALAFLWAFVGGLPIPRSWMPVIGYGSMGLMVLVFIIKGFPLGVRTMNGAMIQLSNELEESSRVLGASWFYTFRRIVAPILSPSFISAWVILFMLTTKDLVTVILLYVPKTTVLSVIMFEHWYGSEYGMALVYGVILTILLLVFAIIARWLGSLREVPS